MSWNCCVAVALTNNVPVISLCLQACLYLSAYKTLGSVAVAYYFQFILKTNSEKVSMCTMTSCVYDKNATVYLVHKHFMILFRLV